MDADHEGTPVLKKRGEEREGGKSECSVEMQAGWGSGGGEGYVCIVRGSVWQLWLLLSLYTSGSVCM